MDSSGDSRFLHWLVGVSTTARRGVTVNYSHAALEEQQRKVRSILLVYNDNLVARGNYSFFHATAPVILA